LPDILDSLVELTAQRERRTLEISLLTTLRELLKDCTVALYNCRWIDGHPWWRIQLDSLDELPHTEPAMDPARQQNAAHPAATG
jgi:hypothetical protein